MQRATDGFHQRRARIRDVCLRYKDILSAANRGSWRKNFLPDGSPVWCGRECPIFLDGAHRLAYCLIPKVASTTVKTVFAPLLNFCKPDCGEVGIHVAFDSRVPMYGPLYLNEGRLENYTTAMFVRHPFERLVSTYVDKALRPRSDVPFFYRTYWDLILGDEKDERRVTFSEFVDFLLSRPIEEADEHWVPYHMTCEPCLFEYDFVGKLETGGQDFGVLFSQVGFDKAEVPLQNRRADSGESFSQSAKKYFAQLDFTRVFRLYEYYFYDFELFGYDFKDYLQVFANQSGKFA